MTGSERKQGNPGIRFAAGAVAARSWLFDWFWFLQPFFCNFKHFDPFSDNVRITRAGITGHEHEFLTIVRLAI
jgi:hypothetical protein